MPNVRNTVCLRNSRRFLPMTLPTRGYLGCSLTKKTTMCTLVLITLQPTVIEIQTSVMRGVGVLLVFFASEVIIDRLKLGPPAVFREISLVDDLDSIFHILDRATEEEAPIKVNGIVVVDVERVVM